jgi:hypothetical protein
MMQTEIGVRLLNEGTDVWVMVPAQPVGANIYVILDNMIEEEKACELEFKPGNLVTARGQINDEGQEFLAAMRLYGIGL